MWNVTSMISRTPLIRENLLDRNPSIVFISETWLKTDNNHVTALVKTYNYILLHKRRKDGDKELGGGVGILLKVGIHYKHINDKAFTSFEHIGVKIRLENGNYLILICIYRVLFRSISLFFEEIVQFFEVLLAQKENVILAGDINIHMDQDEHYPNRFRDILNTFNMCQHVKFPTHKLGHTLDIIATFVDDPKISGIECSEYDLSHHFLVEFDVAIVPEI